MALDRSVRHLACGLLCLHTAHASEADGGKAACLPSGTGAFGSNGSGGIYEAQLTLALTPSKHAWWHLGTGAAGYWLAVSLQLLVLSLRGDPHDYALDYTLFGLLPYVRGRTGEEKALPSEKKALRSADGKLHATGAIRADDEGYATNGHASAANGFQNKCKSQ